MRTKDHSGILSAELGGGAGFGLTKRELYAAFAMAGRLALCSSSHIDGAKVTSGLVANLAVADADALLAALERNLP